MLDVAVAKTGVTVDTGMQVAEDSVLVPPMNETDSASEIETAESVLLCGSGFLNGFPVKFLVDSGAIDYFVSANFAEKEGLLLNKRKEKVKINLADGTMWVSNSILSRLVSILRNIQNFLTSLSLNYHSMKQFWEKHGWTGGILSSIGKIIAWNGRWAKEEFQ